MKPVRVVTGVAAPLDRPDVDTDQIIPKQFLKRIERTGYGQFLFYDWRFLPDGSENADFVLNRPEYRGARILVAGRNFGCGSSREHAPWALQDYGFEVIVAPSFADIFRSNCFQNGILPIELDSGTVDRLLTRVADEAPMEWTVDLEENRIRLGDGTEIPFEVDAFRRECLLNGWDDIGLTLQREEAITQFEAERSTGWRGPRESG